MSGTWRRHSCLLRRHSCRRFWVSAARDVPAGNLAERRDESFSLVSEVLKSTLFIGSRAGFGSSLNSGTEKEILAADERRSTPIERNRFLSALICVHLRPVKFLPRDTI